MKDVHLNLFWQYNSDESINISENNITRNSLLTFMQMDYINKKTFINNLLSKNIINDSNYTFEIELQHNDFKKYLTKINDNNKYLIGFCPSGKVNGTGSIDEIARMIANSKVDQGDIPDGCILIKYGNVFKYAIVFENKLVDLYPEQLKRHFVIYMNTSNGNLSEIYYKNHFLIKSYKEFYNLYKATKGFLNNELLDFMNISGYIYPNSFGELSNIQYNVTKNIEYLLGLVLDGVCKNGKRRRQQGWGEIIDIESINQCISMIGLVYENNTDIKLELKFGSKMSTARTFYKKCKFTFNNNFKKHINASIQCGFMFGYIHETNINMDKPKEFIEYFVNNPNDIKQYTIDDYKNLLLPKIFATQGNKFNPSFQLSAKQLQNHKNNVIPSVTYTKLWNLSDLIKKNCSISQLVNEVINNINECMEIVGIDVNY